MPRALLELHVPDFNPVKKFYSALGFTIAHEVKPHEKKGYLVMDLEENRLCFWCGNGEAYNQSWFKQFPKDTPRGVGVEIVLQVSDVDGLYERVKDNLNVVTPLENKFWGLRDFRLVDPFGFYIRVTSVHDLPVRS